MTQRRHHLQRRAVSKQHKYGVMACQCHGHRPTVKKLAGGFSISNIGELCLGPTMAFLEKSRRMNAGAPMSSGRPLAQFSPRTRSITLTGAQMSGFEPSKSPASAGKSRKSRESCRVSFIFPALFDGVATAFHIVPGRGTTSSNAPAFLLPFLAHKSEFVAAWLAARWSTRHPSRQSARIWHIRTFSHSMAGHWPSGQSRLRYTARQRKLAAWRKSATAAARG